MRVIAGIYRSRPLRALPGMTTRPTSDRLRETLFNVLAATRSLENSVWADLFAGTGAVGIEALSRGAREVVFVEPARPAANTIRDNLRSLGITSRFQLIERPAPEALRQISAPLDFCFLDPPYALHKAYQSVLSALAASALITPTTIVIAEHDKRYDPGESFGPLTAYRRLQQGDAALTFYRLAASD